MNVTSEIEQDIEQEYIERLEALLQAGRRLMTYVQEAAPTDIPNLAQWCRDVDALTGGDE
jgi:hypothetical protein